ncbi:Protein Y32G9B.1 a [Aphelenchoides avenae]|nr:Protein Y32G9B.1 a [Aphelenchus avenae]
MVLLIQRSLAQADRSLMGLISMRDIAELTQIGTQLAAQTVNSNKEILSKPGRPEVRPLSLNASPSEFFGQSLTNMVQPAADQLVRAFNGQNMMQPGLSHATRRAAAAPTRAAVPPIETPTGDLPLEFQSRPLFGGSLGDRGGGGGGGGQLNTWMNLANSFLRGTNGVDGQPLSTDGRPLPSIQQLIPGANKNFGFRQGEGCLPFIGEFMRAAYGNCVRQADEQTWDTWGKEITNALLGGKIDLLRASKETCKRGAEREQCGQLRKAVSDCDIIGSIQVASNMNRAVARCDEISGIIDQNPRTVLNQMNGLINGEMAQGFLNNFLG